MFLNKLSRRIRLENLYCIYQQELCVCVCCVRMCACTGDPLQISWRDMDGLEVYK